MAIAAPLVIPVAEAIWAGILAIGAWLSVQAASQAIDKQFASDGGLVQTCPYPNTMASSKPYVNDPQAAKEHDAYKTIANEPPPPDLDECQKLKWLLRREQLVVIAMQVWDIKWLPGRHDEAIKQRTNGIENLKKKIKRVCGE